MILYLTLYVSDCAKAYFFMYVNVQRHVLIYMTIQRHVYVCEYANV